FRLDPTPRTASCCFTKFDSQTATMTGPDVIATSIRNSPTKTSTIDELLAKLLGILGLENSTGDNTNPPSKVTNSSIVHPTAFYTSPNTGGSLYYPNV
ncbi:hypothetical protein Tco_0108164, partial [Tanacetum coccineum]